SFSSYRVPPALPSFPTRRSSDLDLSAVPGRFESPIVWRRDLPADKQNACPMVAGRYFRNLTNGSSPRWLQDRLTAIGLRPISARSEEHTSELQSLAYLVCRLLLE